MCLITWPLNEIEAGVDLALTTSFPGLFGFQHGGRSGQDPGNKVVETWEDPGNQAPVIQTMDSAIRQINPYPVDM